MSRRVSLMNEAIEVLRARLDPGLPVSVISLPVKYPQGAEKMLIKTVFDKEVPAGQLPRPGLVPLTTSRSCRRVTLLISTLVSSVATGASSRKLGRAMVRLQAKRSFIFGTSSQFSASAGILGADGSPLKRGIRLHLFYVLARPAIGCVC